jgi:hypothetical protein
MGWGGGRRVVWAHHFCCSLVIQSLQHQSMSNWSRHRWLAVMRSIETPCFCLWLCKCMCFGHTRACGVQVLKRGVAVERDEEGRVVGGSDQATPIDWLDGRSLLTATSRVAAAGGSRQVCGGRGSSACYSNPPPKGTDLTLKTQVLYDTSQKRKGKGRQRKKGGKKGGGDGGDSGAAALQGGEEEEAGAGLTRRVPVPSFFRFFTAIDRPQVCDTFRVCMWSWGHYALLYVAGREVAQACMPCCGITPPSRPHTGT